MANSTPVNKAVTKRLSKQRLFYVCRDVERAVGGSLNLKNYFIITNQNESSQKLAKQNPNIIIIKNKKQLDTSSLLARPEVKKLIKPKDFVLVFKNNSIIEKICQENKWRLLNPPANLAEEVESKVSQVGWLGNLTKYLPPHKIDICRNINWNGRPFVLQFNHSHTGSGIFLINSKKELDNLKNKFDLRPVRIMEFITGPVFTNNNIVWGNKTLTGNISYQITGLSPFTENKFTTIGNDFALPSKILNSPQIKQYKKIAIEIGKKLGKDGWKGLFGLDIIMNQETRQLYLLEINARQPASTTFESQLQDLKLKTKSTEINSFTAHLAALLDIKPNKTELIKINNGAQIVQRVTNKISKIKKLAIKDNAIIDIINYKNTTLGADLMRIKSNQTIMEKHGTFNSLGKIIAKSIC